MTDSVSASKCRGCGNTLTTTFVDLGVMPLVNIYLPLGSETAQERFPLHARVCDNCLLVQIEDVVPPDALFSDYAYFSSYSESWLAHAERFAREAQRDFGLDSSSMVVEVASNDGYLLKHFMAAGIPVVGVEPASNIAREANDAGIPTVNRFFGREAAGDLVGEGKLADLVVANNVMAHVPDLHDFVDGLATVLKPGGVASAEFTHVLRILDDVQFDTIYHEHFSYFSLYALEPVLEAHGLEVFDVVELPTHGGSLRVLAQLADGPKRPAGRGLEAVRAKEKQARLDALETYTTFADQVERRLESVRSFLSKTREEAKTVVGYAAASKGTILLNAAGITSDEVAYVVDLNPHKQDRFLPGTRIPIYAPAKIRETRLDFLLLLAWNLTDEIMSQMAYIREFGGRFVTPIPDVRVIG